MDICEILHHFLQDLTGQGIIRNAIGYLLNQVSVPSESFKDRDVILHEEFAVESFETSVIG